MTGVSTADPTSTNLLPDRKEVIVGKSQWSGNFPPPGAGDGKVRMPEAQWGCLRVVAPACAAVLGCALVALRVVLG